MEKTGKEVVLEALQRSLHDARFTLECHLDQLPEVEQELTIRKKAYEEYVGFPAEVQSWIDRDRKRIQTIEQAIASVEQG